MTHDELLAKIIKWYDYAQGSISQVHGEFCISSDGCKCEEYDPVTNEIHKALRAVVELHNNRGYWFCNECSQPNNEVMYPCPTIQAIEKELA